MGYFKDMAKTCDHYDRLALAFQSIKLVTTPEGETVFVFPKRAKEQKDFVRQIENDALFGGK